MGRDRVCLPFQFLLKSAQGHLKKANFLRKSSMHSQELHYLKKLEVLVSSAIPSHPQYEENKYDKVVLEFESRLDETRARIEELERKSRVVPKLQKPSLLKSRIDKLSSSKTDSSSHKETADDACSSDSSLRSKLTESVKLLSPTYSPRRLERCLKAAAKGSCLEQEAFFRGKEWLKLELEGCPEGSESEGEIRKDPAMKLENLAVKSRSSETQEHQQKSRSVETQEQQQKPEAKPGDSKPDDLSNLYKKFLGSARPGELVQEFRRALESSAREKVGFTEELFRHEEARSEKVFKAAKMTSRENEEDFVSDFMASTRTLLNKSPEKQHRKQQQEQHQQQEPEQVVKASENTEADPALKWMSSPEPSKESSRHSRMKPRPLRRDTVDSEMESLVKAKVDKAFSGMMGTLVSGTEQALSSIKAELENVREAGSQLRSETEDMKNRSENRLEEFHQVVVKVQKDGSDMKAQLQGLKKLEDSLRHDAEAIIRKTFERFDRDKKQELQEVRRLLTAGEGDRAVMMERIERLSQQYIGGLEDVRAELASLKAGPEAGARAEALLAEMRNRRKKSMQLESVMKNAVEAALKLQEKYSVELEKAKDNWSWAMNLQIGEAKAVLGEITEQSHTIGDRGGVLLTRVQTIEGEVRQLMAKPPLNELAIYESLAKHKEGMHRELRKLDELMQEALKKLETGSGSDSLRAELEEKLREVVRSRATIVEKLNETGKRVRKLEGAQLNLVRSVEELRTSTSDLEASACTWLPKCETAAGLLKEVDARLGVAEKLIKGIEASQARTSAGEEDARSKFESLEERVEHVASETLNELRVLDTKVEQCKAGVQSAIEGAAVAENKCSVLGAEIVKVFRMFAAKNGKLTELPGAKTPGSTSQQKEKSHVGCKSCKRLSNDDVSPGLRRVAGAPPSEEYYKPGKRASERPSFIDSYAEILYQSGRLHNNNASTSRVKTGPVSSDDDDPVDEEEEVVSPRVKCRGKAFREMKGAAVKNFQRSNIRLEAGKVVPVSH